MPPEEFMKQQYLTLREEICAGKARMFWLLILASLLIPAAGFAANEFRSTFASASIPFVVLVLMLAFVMEQNGIIRAGRYLKEHVEPHLENTTTWEKWLESNHKLREVDRYFFASFLLIFFLFYAVGAGTAIASLADSWPEHWRYAAVGYGVGALWILIVFISHWHSCTTTKG